MHIGQVGRSAAEQLTGLVLDGGWMVGERIDPPGGTGGCFSVRYHVSDPAGKRAFLKALDATALWAEAQDIAQALQTLVDNYVFERTLVEQCDGMSRVVRGLASGEATVPNVAFGRVPYIIFELAEHGDIRRHMSLESTIGIAWKLRTLHHIAVGMQQLHNAEIVHQDMKPSNVLVFEDCRKIGDLGRAARKNAVGPFDDHAVPGDLNYPPIECYYGYGSPEWQFRLSYDMYLLGSMVVFIFAQTTINALILSHLDNQFFPAIFTGSFSEVQPYLLRAFNEALDEFERSVNNAAYGPELKHIVAELCYPHPDQRGARAIDTSRRLHLETYISRFNRLARQAELTGRA